VRLRQSALSEVAGGLKFLEPKQSGARNLSDSITSAKDNLARAIARRSPKVSWMTAEATSSGPSVSTLLATDRTRLAHDRTLMAWVRTATSLISFGFTIYKFFQYMQEKGTPSQHRLFGP
jgi:hypothetical protein